jgi:hypothetical protein
MNVHTTTLKVLLLGAVTTGGILASAPVAAACDPGFYPTGTDGVCSDMPPAVRPARVQLKDLPFPIQQAINRAAQGGINAWLDSDGDGWSDLLDRAALNPYRH